MVARNRGRRVAPSSNRGDDRAESSTKQEKPADSASSRPTLTVIFVFVVLFIASSAILISLNRPNIAPMSICTDDSYVRQQGLIKPDTNYREILAENTKVSENMSHRHYNYPVLAYITPWNSRGYEAAKRFNSKFTHLSPVWYDLKSEGSGLVLQGRHNADVGWMSDLRMAGNAKVLPRVVLEAFPQELLTKKKQRNRAISLILKECREMGYDGIVLESWSRWASYGVLSDPILRNSALQFIKQLGNELHSVISETNDKQLLELIFVIGPPRSEKLQELDFGPQDLKILNDSVDGFSLMTYDFSSPHNPGPNAPLKWISLSLNLLLGDNLKNLARKIFLGINFYGNDFLLSKSGGGGAITRSDYLPLLEKHKPVFEWEKNIGEHFFFYSDDNDVKHAVFYPTLMSISMRLEEARKRGCGISIWEIGQGLDYFFDLL